MSPSICNIARYLPLMAQQRPHSKAVIFAHKRDEAGRRTYASLTFSQLNDLSNQYAHGFREYGFYKGMKVLLAVKPSIDFIALTFALFKIGAVPVLIDPGMGKTSLLSCIHSVSPEAMVAIPAAHIARILNPRSFSGMKKFVTVGKRFWGGKTLEELKKPGASEFEIMPTKPDDMAAIVFTTGSTGTPKGVVYFHEQMEGQVESIREEYQINETDVDFPVFPLFALFSTAWGIPAVLPDLDPTRPAKADPSILVEEILDHGVTMSIGSLAVFARIAAWCNQKKITLPSVRRFCMVGAPVPIWVLEAFSQILPQGDTYTPYGATEALPAANISGSHILMHTKQKQMNGYGTCIGLPFPGVEIRIIAISEDPIAVMQPNMALPSYEVGEICVRGKITTREYYQNEKATSLAKIREGKQIWHRMGDLGYFDDQGYLWFCGRKAHRVVSAQETLYTVPCEAIFNNHPDVFRSALVGVEYEPKNVVPVMIIEMKDKKHPQTFAQKQEIALELRKISISFSHTQNITRILFHPSFPVDIRHNAKIFREKLAVWAKTQFPVEVI